MTDNLIERFENDVSQYCDAPIGFIKCGSHFLAASLLGRYCLIPEMPFGGRPNPWFIIASIPGRMRRSSALNYTEYVYDKALTRHFSDVLPFDTEELEGEYSPEAITDLRELNAKKYVSKTKISDGTPEGISDAIQTGYEMDEYQIKSFGITSGEFGGTIKQIVGKGYRQGVAQLFSKLKYGEEDRVYLSQRGGKRGLRYIPRGLFVTMLCSMQEPQQYLSEVQSRQGLLRRMMIYFVKPEELSMDHWLPPLRSDREEVWNSLYQIADSYYNRMKKMDEGRSMGWSYLEGEEYVPILIDSDVRDRINDIAEEVDENLIQESNDFNIYRQGRWEQLLELAATNSLARSPIGLAESAFYVQMEDLEKAIDFHDLISKNAKEMLDELSVSKGRVETEERQLNRIYGYINERGSAGIERSKLLNKSKMIAKKLDDHIKTLVQGERIMRVGYGSTGGRPKTAYISMEWVEDAKREGRLEMY